MDNLGRPPKNQGLVHLKHNHDEERDSDLFVPRWGDLYVGIPTGLYLYLYNP